MGSLTPRSTFWVSPHVVIYLFCPETSLRNPSIINCWQSDFHQLSVQSFPLPYRGCFRYLSGRRCELWNWENWSGFSSLCERKFPIYPVRYILRYDGVSKNIPSQKNFPVKSQAKNIYSSLYNTPHSNHIYNSSCCLVHVAWRAFSPLLT